MKTKMKVIAGLAFLLNTLLFGSYYSVAKEALERVDPIVFTFFVMMTLVPPAICIIAFSWRQMNREAVKSGFLLGSCLCLGLFTLAVALKYNSATGTAFFPSLNGLLAAIFTWIFLRQPITKSTWFAGLVSVSGAVLLMLNASMGGARGALIAFIGGLFCTFYVFLADHEQKGQTAYWPLFGVELLTMGLWGSLLALLFGDWQVVHLALPKDLWVVLYIGIGTTLLPTIFTVWLQKYISPITVSFIYILEPILGAVVAFLYLHEVLPLDGYIGGLLVVAGVVIHTWGTVERPQRLRVERMQPVAVRAGQTSWFNALIYPMVCSLVGVLLVYKLGGFPPAAWYELASVSPQLPGLLQGAHRVDALLLLGQSFSWLLAWGALIALGGLAMYRSAAKLLAGAPEESLDLDVRTLRQVGYTVQNTTTYDSFPQAAYASIPTPVGEQTLSLPRVQPHRVHLTHLEQRTSGHLNQVGKEQSFSGGEYGHEMLKSQIHKPMEQEIMPTTATLDALEMLETLERLAQMSDFEVSDDYEEQLPLTRTTELASSSEWESNTRFVNMSSGGRLLSLPALPSSDNASSMQGKQQYSLPALQEDKGGDDKGDPWTWWN